MKTRALMLFPPHPPGFQEIVFESARIGEGEDSEDSRFLMERKVRTFLLRNILRTAVQVRRKGDGVNIT